MVNDAVLKALIEGMEEEVANLEAALRTKYEERAKDAERAKGEAVTALASLKQDLEALRLDAEASRARIAQLEQYAGVLVQKLAQATTALAEQSAHKELQRAADEAKEKQARLEALLTGERTANAVLRQQLAHAEAASTANHKRLEQAIETMGQSLLAAVNNRPAPQLPPPPTYEMIVTGRDVNSRPQRITLKPKE